MHTKIAALLITTSLFTSTSVASTRTLTIATYNIHGGVPNGSSSASYDLHPRDLLNIAEVLTSSGASVVALQEVRCEWLARRAAGRNVFAANLARFIAYSCHMNYAFGSTLHDTAGYPANTDYMEWGSGDHWMTNGAPHGEFGNAVLSSGTITGQPANIVLPNDPGEEQRACLRVQLAGLADSTPVVIYATHLNHRGGSLRQRQLRAILDVAKTETTTATVFVLGDFNYHAHPGEPDLLSDARGAGFRDLAALHAAQGGKAPANTFPAEKPDRRIDYILCSRELPVLDIHTIETSASDHLPLVATVVLQ